MSSPPERRIPVFDRTGQEAMILPEVVGPDKILLQTTDGQKIALPRVLLHTRQDGAYEISVAFSSFLDPSASSSNDQTRVIPLADERMQVEKRKVNTTRVLVHKRIEEREEILDEPIWSEEVELRRFQVNQLVDEVPEPRQEGDALVIPLVEEVLVVEKRILLREEVHVVKERKSKASNERVTLRKEVLEVERQPIEQEHGIHA